MWIFCFLLEVWKFRDVRTPPEVGPPTTVFLSTSLSPLVPDVSPRWVLGSGRGWDDPRDLLSRVSMAPTHTEGGEAPSGAAGSSIGHPACPRLHPLSRQWLPCPLQRGGVGSEFPSLQVPPFLSGGRVEFVGVVGRRSHGTHTPVCPFDLPRLFSSTSLLPRLVTGPVYFHVMT